MNIFRKNILSASIAIGLSTLAPSLLAQGDTPEISSARQESRIGTTFELNRYLREYDIDVSVSGGEATLVGIVDEDITKDLAEEIALSVTGIDSVDNQIEIQPEHIKEASDSEKRSFGETVDDVSITAAVKSKLMWSRHIAGLKTEVSTADGVVTLSGTADSGEAKELANMLAENTHGVISVNNELAVLPDGGTPDAASENGSTAQTISDAWITTKVKSTFIMSSNVRSRDISVSTKDGIVSLSGTVLSDAERELAIALATNVRGVQSVNSDDIDYIDRQ